MNDNLKTNLTVGDIKNIQKYLELQKNNCDETDKIRIDELIKKLDEMEAKS